MKTLAEIDREVELLMALDSEIKDRMLVLDVLADAAWEEENATYSNAGAEEVA